jgi:acetyl-CoA acyltransferase
MEFSMPASLRDVRVVDDIGLFKVNETFAGVPLIVRGSASPDDELNVNGGSVAIGHPPGSAVAPVLTDPLCEPERSQSRHGLPAICGSDGTLSAAVIECQ